MSSLDIAVAQPGFQNHLCTFRAQTPLHSKVISSPFTFQIDKKLSSSWKSSDVPKKLYFNSGHIKTPRSRLLIQAVATFEAKSVLFNENGHLGLNSSEPHRNSSPFQPETSSDDSSELDEKEKLRRLRISKANKGNTPWNKGKKHSPETRQLIKERTRQAMQDPKYMPYERTYVSVSVSSSSFLPTLHASVSMSSAKTNILIRLRDAALMRGTVKMKLVNLGHSQTKETRTKIGIGVRMGWERRRKKLSLQENCCYEWQNLIAEASRQGYDCEEELQWDSYKILDAKHKEEYLESIEQRKVMRRPKGSKRAPKSLEQRRKISQAISAKWNDPEYRDRVCSGLSKYYDSSFGAERKTRKRSPGNTESPRRRSPTKKKEYDLEEKKISRNEIKLQKQKLRRSKGPMYKDPLASSKMEMIKNIRAQRAATETKKTEAIEQARLLIAEAEKAAMALEVSATKSPVARASLIETRQLIAEAIRSIDSIDTMQISSHEDEEPSVASNEVIGPSENENRFWGLTDADGGKVNGTQTFSVKEDTDPFLAANEVLSQMKKERSTGSGGPTEAYNGKVNGTRTLLSTKDEDLGLDEFTLLDMLSDEDDLPMSSDIDDALPLSTLGQSGSTIQSNVIDEFNLQDMLSDKDDLQPMSSEGDGLPCLEQSVSGIQSEESEPNDNDECSNNLQLNGIKVESQDEETPSRSATVTKKWVRGRLVEVPEGA